MRLSIQTRFLFTTIVAIFLSISCFSQNATDTVVTVRLTDFGVQPNSFQNASPAIAKAIEFCRYKSRVILILPPGRIDCWPTGAHNHELYISNATEDDSLSKNKHVAFCLDLINNITIEGENTLIVLHEKMVSFAFLKSNNIVLKNVRFDYERPTMSEFTIKALSGDSAEVVFNPDSKYYIDEQQRINLYGEGWESKAFHAISFSPAENTMKYSSFQPFLESKAVSVAPLRVRFRGNFSTAKSKVGDILTVRDPYRDNVGALIAQSKNIRIENVGMQYMHGLGIVSQFSENITLFKVRVAPSSASGRVISSFADCFHFSGCKGQLLIDSCFTSGSHDDPINVHGTHLKIVAVKENKLTARFMHHQTYGFEAFFAGDSIAFVNPNTLLPTGNAIVKTAKLINRREMELELQSQLPAAVKTGDCIENITWTPELTVRNSRFERTNTRGILITTRRKVVVENNVFYKTGMHAILIADDAASWYESGAVQDVTIRNNRFEECGYNLGNDGYVIAIAPENHQLVKNKTVHSNIRIQNNEFILSTNQLLTAKSVYNLQFTNNKVSTLPSVTAANTRLIACKKVIFRDNVFAPPITPSIVIDDMDKKEIRADSLVKLVKK